MRDPSLGFLAFSSPFSRPWHQLLLELAVLACTVLVLAHAIRAYRRGDRRPMFQWLLLTSYGVQMELIAFNFLHNYEHARFTVQLVDGQLPLYVTGLYGTFMCAGTWIAERLGARPIVECFVAGLAMCLIDVPFDVAGVSVGWWRWLDGDPNLAFRWLGVPVTSYYWYLIFGAVSTALARALWSRLERRSFGLAVPVALVAGSGVVFFGVLGFLPFHAVHAMGVSEGAIVAVHIAACIVLALASRGERKPVAPVLAAAAWIVPAVGVIVLVATSASGTLDHPIERIGASLASLVALVALSLALPWRAPLPPLAAASPVRAGADA